MVISEGFCNGFTNVCRMSLDDGRKVVVFRSPRHIASFGVFNGTLYVFDESCVLHIHERDGGGETHKFQLEYPKFSLIFI